MTDTAHRLDELDRQILYTLMQDSRNPTASAIAKQAGVSGATVRNRIQKLEETGVIRGYTAQIDFERAGGKLTNLYLCNAPVPQRETLAHEARTIPGVIHVRSIMTGRQNLHVLAVGETTAEFKKIARRLSQLGIEIEDEDLVEDELFDCYMPFSPDENRETEQNGMKNLMGETEVIEVQVSDDAAIAGLTLEEASSRGVIDDDTLIVGIEREHREFTPDGETVIEPDDLVTLLSDESTDTETLAAFQGRQTEQ